MQIGLVLTAVNQLCGGFAMINYTASIYAESGSNLSPTMSAIVTSCIQVLGVYCSTLLVDRAGRKVCTYMSAKKCNIANILKSYLKLFSSCWLYQRPELELLTCAWERIRCLQALAIRWSDIPGFRWSVFRCPCSLHHVEFYRFHFMWWPRSCRLRY